MPLVLDIQLMSDIIQSCHFTKGGTVLSFSRIFPQEQTDCFSPTVKMENRSDERFFSWIQTHIMIPVHSRTFAEGLSQEPNAGVVPRVSKSGVRQTHIHRNVNTTLCGDLVNKTLCDAIQVKSSNVFGCLCSHRVLSWRDE